MASEGHQQHPLRVYLWIWFLLFVLSVFSYLVDYVGMEGYLKWTLITLFMLMKAGLIISVFMHMVWERLAIISVVLVPPGVLLFLMGLMMLESNHTLVSRLTFFAN
ncbi:cytochrome C oxidase subunit IV family protein [Halomonas sp. M4R5S39]|uniref:Cytochrome C oxidase subunit IV family protein n=1 Tax=Halomonas kalidii TaxID=3043293 RepID=A0ABT6VHG9_9GAMM|nr:cytochrome C oxidase subunit IV family protein [Halomonas kalidii]MDI5933100.1 cytochrome C oxidase subunit IV family protein [Halomonas kalidii]MDI5985066.1 cytochrome C oxidase subunit IV family protein [Halomonas kalidii]